MTDAEDWDDDDPELPDWPEDSDATATFPCARCGAEVYEEAPCCPVCGEFVVAPDATGWKSKPWWFVFLALAGIAAVVLTLLSP